MSIPKWTANNTPKSYTDLVTKGSDMFLVKCADGTFVEASSEIGQKNISSSTTYYLNAGSLILNASSNKEENTRDTTDYIRVQMIKRVFSNVFTVSVITILRAVRVFSLYQFWPCNTIESQDGTGGEKKEYSLCNRVTNFATDSALIALSLPLLVIHEIVALVGVIFPDLTRSAQSWLEETVLEFDYCENMKPYYSNEEMNRLEKAFKDRVEKEKKKRQPKDKESKGLDSKIPFSSPPSSSSTSSETSSSTTSTSSSTLASSSSSSTSSETNSSTTSTSSSTVASSSSSSTSSEITILITSSPDESSSSSSTSSETSSSTTSTSSSTVASSLPSSTSSEITILTPPSPPKTLASSSSSSSPPKISILTPSTPPTPSSPSTPDKLSSPSNNSSQRNELTPIPLKKNISHKDLKSLRPESVPLKNWKRLSVSSKLKWHTLQPAHKKSLLEMSINDQELHFDLSKEEQVELLNTLNSSPQKQLKQNKEEQPSSASLNSPHITAG